MWNVVAFIILAAQKKYMLKRRGRGSKKDNKKTPRKSLSLVLPLIAGLCTSIAAPQPSYPQKPRAARVSKKKKSTVSLQKITTALRNSRFSTGIIENKKNYFSVDRFLKFPNGTHLVLSAQLGKMSRKTRFAVGVQLPGRKTKPTLHLFDLKILRLMYEKSGKQLNAWKIGFEKKNKVVVFYVVPFDSPNGIPVSGIPVGVFTYNKSSRMTKKEKIKVVK